jgi:hypothetical protein
MKYLKTLMIASMGLFTLVSCDENKEVEMEVGDTELSVEMDNDRSEFEKRMEDFGERIDKKIAEIDAELKEAGEEVREDLSEEREEWVEARKELGEKMKKLSGNAKDNWTDFKSEAQNWLKEIEVKFES